MSVRRSDPEACRYVAEQDTIHAECSGFTEETHEQIEGRPQGTELRAPFP